MRAVRGTCTVDGCERPHKAHGWCKAHYFRWRDHGDPLGGRPPRSPVCTVDGCGEPHQARGYCGTHYRRWWEHGDPNHVTVLAGPLNPGWRGDNIRNRSLHQRLGRQQGPASAYPCQHCGGPAAEWAYDHADPAERDDPRGPYSLDPAHYLPLCRPCHRRFDYHRAVA
jgi:hypothetical protein